MRADIIEASEYPALARQYNVYAVPKTVVNETHEVVGALPEAEFVRAVVAGVAPPAPA